MKTAQQWWRETAEDEAWVDDQAAIIERIQRDAFLAGAVAQRDELVRLAPIVVQQLPQVLVHASVAVAIARSVDPEQVAVARFGIPAAAIDLLVDPPTAAPPAMRAADTKLQPGVGCPADGCPRCRGEGDLEHEDDQGGPHLILCPDCGGTGRA